MKLIISLEWISRMGEHRRVTPQKIRTPVTRLLRWRRWRLSVDLLQCMNSVVQGGHHLHLELGWSVPWLFCPCWPEPVQVFLVFTIYLQQNEFYKRQILYNFGKKTLAG
jgi:hypothetical protein